MHRPAPSTQTALLNYLLLLFFPQSSCTSQPYSAAQISIFHHPAPANHAALLKYRFSIILHQRAKQRCSNVDVPSSCTSKPHNITQRSISHLSKKAQIVLPCGRSRDHVGLIFKMLETFASASLIIQQPFSDTSAEQKKTTEAPSGQAFLTCMQPARPRAEFAAGT